MHKFLNKTTLDLALLATLKQFDDQVTNRLLLSVLEEYEDSIQKKDVKKAPVKMLPSTLSKHCM